MTKIIVALVLAALLWPFIRPQAAELYEDGSYSISGCLPFMLCQK